MISYLTPSEKKYILRGLERELEAGEVDPELVDGLREINSLPGVVTTQSCVGHGEGCSGYLSLRMTKTLLKRFEYNLPVLMLKPWCEWPEMNYELTVNFDLRPRMVIWFKAGHHNEALRDIINLLKMLVTESR